MMKESFGCGVCSIKFLIVSPSLLSKLKRFKENEEAKEDPHTLVFLKMVQIGKL